MLQVRLQARRYHHSGHSCFAILRQKVLQPTIPISTLIVSAAAKDVVLAASSPLSIVVAVGPSGSSV
jgi:hypothetical protein